MYNKPADWLEPPSLFLALLSSAHICLFCKARFASSSFATLHAIVCLFHSSPATNPVAYATYPSTTTLLPVSSSVKTSPVWWLLSKSFSSIHRH